MTSIQSNHDIATLASLIIKEIGGDYSTPTLIHAGHYALTTADGCAADNLANESASVSAIQDIVDLARITWEAGCEVTSLFVPGNCRLMTLVNDWQFLDGTAESRRERARWASRARREYYRNMPKLPPMFSRALECYGLSYDVVFKSNSKRWLFSENELRTRLSTTVSDLLRDPVAADSLGLSHHFTASGDPIVQAVDDDGGKFCLLYCGNTNCAGEFLQLLGDLHANGIRRFINLYPMQCRNPVLTGGALARKIFGLSGMRVINIALPSSPFRTSGVCIDREDD